MATVASGYPNRFSSLPLRRSPLAVQSPNLMNENPAMSLIQRIGTTSNAAPPHGDGKCMVGEGAQQDAP